MKKRVLGSSGLAYIGRSKAGGRTIEFYDNVTPDGKWLFFAVVKEDEAIMRIGMPDYLRDVALLPLKPKLAKTLVKNGVPFHLVYGVEPGVENEPDLGKKLIKKFKKPKNYVVDFVKRRK